MRLSLWIATLVLALGAAANSAGSTDEYDVDLALVLAIDCSFSVDAHEYQLQMEGLGRALQQPAVLRAIRAGNRQRIAVAAMLWSDEESQVVVLPWSVIAGEPDAREVGQILMTMPRKLAEGGTSISMALRFADHLLASAPRAARRVIDISSDGRNNAGPPVYRERDRVLAEGITINALVILNEWPTLDRYFENQVTGGEAHFVIPGDDYGAYEQAIYKKLLREITGPGIS